MGMPSAVRMLVCTNLVPQVVTELQISLLPAYLKLLLSFLTHAVVKLVLICIGRRVRSESIRTKMISV